MSAPFLSTSQSFVCEMSEDNASQYAFATGALMVRLRHGALRNHGCSSRPTILHHRNHRPRHIQCTIRPTDNDGDRDGKDKNLNNNGAIGGAMKSLEASLLLGNQLTPELAAILSVYFVQGVLSLPRLALSFFLKDELALSPAVVAQLSAAATLPWVIKPVYGFLTDTIPIANSRRRSYLVLSGIFGSLSWLWLAAGVHDETGALIASLISAGSVAIADVVADSLVVERIRKGAPNIDGGKLQTLCWGSSAIGGLIAAALSGSLLALLGTRGVFGLTALLPATVALAAGLVDEKPTPMASNIGQAVRERSLTLWNALTARRVALPVAFVFVWQAAPSPDSALFFFQTNVLHFGPEFLGIVRFVSSAAALGGLYCYQKYWTQVPVKKVMKVAALISVPLSLTQLILVTRLNTVLGISDQVFALTDTAVLTALGQVAFMPTLVLAARLCPPGIEGTLFAALMSIYNASGAVSTELGALLTHALNITENNFDNLALLVAICSFSNLAALPLLGFLDAAPKQGDSALDTDPVVDADSKKQILSVAADDVNT